MNDSITAQLCDKIPTLALNKISYALKNLEFSIRVGRSKKVLKQAGVVHGIKSQ